MKRLLVFVVGMSLLHLPIAHASAQGAIALTGGVNLASLSVGGLGPVSPGFGVGHPIVDRAGRHHSVVG